jgi:ribonucleoside-diphosphate reductase alpha chain
VDWLKLNGYDPDAVTKMNDQEIETIIAKSPYYKATANDVDWVAKVKMQGAIQKWVDHSISVTINLPAEVKEELVSELYMTAWKSGCKGATVYRDGSRNNVLTQGKRRFILKGPRDPRSLMQMS